MTNLSAICMSVGLTLTGSIINVLIVLGVLALTGVVAWFMNKKLNK